jgi:hypothetical protein
MRRLARSVLVFSIYGCVCICYRSKVGCSLITQKEFSLHKYFEIFYDAIEVGSWDGCRLCRSARCHRGDSLQPLSGEKGCLGIGFAGILCFARQEYWQSSEPKAKRFSRAPRRCFCVAHLHEMHLSGRGARQRLCFTSTIVKGSQTPFSN